MVTHHVTKHLTHGSTCRDMGHTLSSFDSVLGLRPSSAIKTASGIYPISHLLPCVNYYIVLQLISNPNDILVYCAENI